MTREALLSMTRREVENFQRRRIDLAPDIYRVPTRLYSDPDRFRLEVERIFKRLPLALGFSCELREAGTYRALTVAGVPVIMARGDDGHIRAFVNMCSHRGNFVVEEGSGKAKNFRCNYHAWSYDLRGELISIFDESNFGAFDKSCNGLTPLPVAERAGLIWVTLNPASEVDIDAFLDGYGEMLAHLRFEDTHLAGRQYLDGPNWKVAYDGYRDFYHVPILHRETFGPDGPFQPDYYAWGSHVRVTSPKGHDAFAEKVETSWSEDEMTSGVWTIFPNVSIAGSPATGGFMVSQMYPGERVGESFTIQNFLRFGSPDEMDSQELEQHMQFMRRVVQDEDYGTGLNVQKALATGAKEYSYFGRNEGGGQLFHRWVDALVEAEDADVPALLRSGVSWDVSPSDRR
jgi:phenylpropionate dioxygenase-like ring-hydroxylating dioxygenase large terminal subunit